MIDQRLQELWPRLQGKKPHLPHFLDGVRLPGIRGIRNLRVSFDYSASVIASSHASGKPTVLFATASAYQVPGAGVKDFVPSTLFPDYRPNHGDREDQRQPVTVEFEYSTPNRPLSMRWRRVKGCSGLRGSFCTATHIPHYRPPDGFFPVAIMSFYFRGLAFPGLLPRAGRRQRTFARLA